jgi:hypothetical protein
MSIIESKEQRQRDGRGASMILRCPLRPCGRPIDRGPLEGDPNAGRKPATAVLRNLGADYIPCSLAVRAGTAHARLSGAGIRGIPVPRKVGPQSCWTILPGIWWENCHVIASESQSKRANVQAVENSLARRLKNKRLLSNLVHCCGNEPWHNPSCTCGPAPLGIADEKEQIICGYPELRLPPQSFWERLDAHHQSPPLRSLSRLK